MSFVSQLVNNCFDLSISLLDHLLSHSLLEVLFLLIELPGVLLYPLLLVDGLLLAKALQLVGLLALELVNALLALFTLLLYKGFGLGLEGRELVL